MGKIILVNNVKLDENIVSYNEEKSRPVISHLCGQHNVLKVYKLVETWGFDNLSSEWKVRKEVTNG